MPLSEEPGLYPYRVGLPSGSDYRTFVRTTLGHSIRGSRLHMFCSFNALNPKHILPLCKRLT